MPFVQYEVQKTLLLSITPLHLTLYTNSAINVLWWKYVTFANMYKYIYAFIHTLTQTYQYFPKKLNNHLAAWSDYTSLPYLHHKYWEIYIE